MHASLGRVFLPVVNEEYRPGVSLDTIDRLARRASLHHLPCVCVTVTFMESEDGVQDRTHDQAESAGCRTVYWW
jgi:hypothetical protein